MKKFLCLVLCFVLMSMTAFAATFTDVSNADYYATAAANLSEKGILTGYPDGTFGPEKTIIRAEITAVIIRMLGKDADAKALGGTASFADVDVTNWASGYIALASKEGIVNGYGAEFKPQNPVKFEEAITMVVRAVGLENEVEKDAADWSKGYLDVAREKGILNGLTGSKGESATRGDVAVMVYNGLNMKVADVPTQNPTETPNETPDESGLEETYEVTFIEDVENEVIYLVKEVKDGEMVEMPADPTMEGYEFTGWYIDEAMVDIYNFLTPVTNNITIYAGWVEEEEEEEIYFDEDGNPIDPEELEYDEDGNPIYPEEDEEFYEE